MTPSEEPAARRSPRIRRETSAGGVVFRTDGDKTLILLIRDAHRNWGFPKGHVERGEDPATAAMREVLQHDLPGQVNHFACWVEDLEAASAALIEQGMQVFTSIYKRIYRSMTREFALVARLNARYLDQQKYAAFFDVPPPPAPHQAAQSACESPRADAAEPPPPTDWLDRWP